MNIHASTLRNKSTGSWFYKLKEKEKPETYWVFLSRGEEYSTMTLPTRQFAEGKLVDISNTNYRLPQEIIDMLPSFAEFEQSMITPVVIYNMLRVTVVPLGKGRYTKIRPYRVRLTEDTYRVLSKRAWEITGGELENKVWRFDRDKHAAFTEKGVWKRGHVKYPIRDALTYVEEFEAPFSEENFKFDCEPQRSVLESLNFLHTDTTDTRVKYWCYSRMRLVRSLLRRLSV